MLTIWRCVGDVLLRTWWRHDNSINSNSDNKSVLSTSYVPSDDTEATSSINSPAHSVVVVASFIYCDAAAARSRDRNLRVSDWPVFRPLRPITARRTYQSTAVVTPMCFRRLTVTWDGRHIRFQWSASTSYRFCVYRINDYKISNFENFL